jgi:cohesin complex subunit SA-1/2
MVLTKILASSFIIHGNHFAVLKHLHPDDAQNFHTGSISRIFAKIATYVAQERRTGRKETKAHYAAKRAQCLTIFKCLILLLGPVNGRGALKIKSEMESGLRNVVGVAAGVNKMWEGLKAYEKRLVLIASKDSNIRAGAARVVEQQEEEAEAEGEGEDATERSVSPTPRQAREASLPDMPEVEDEIMVEPDMDFDLGLEEEPEADPETEVEQQDEEEGEQEQETTPKSQKGKRAAAAETAQAESRPKKKTKSKK